MVKKLFTAKNGWNTYVIGVEKDRLENKHSIYVVKGKHPLFSEFVHFLCAALQEDLQEAAKYQRKNPWKVVHYAGSSGCLDFNIKWVEDVGCFFREMEAHVLHVSMAGKVGEFRGFLPDLLEVLKWLGAVDITEDGTVRPTVRLVKELELEYDRWSGDFRSKFIPIQLPIFEEIRYRHNWYDLLEENMADYELEVEQIPCLTWGEICETYNIPPKKKRGRYAFLITYEDESYVRRCKGVVTYGEDEDEAWEAAKEKAKEFAGFKRIISYTSEYVGE